MKTKAFVTVSESTFSPEVMPEAQLQLYSTAKPDREPVKILVIGSPSAVNTIIHLIHQHRFAEVFEWTQFLPTDRPIQLQPGQAMKALVKYLPSS
ncbi:MAG: hypothetical protein AAF152_02970 [Cyanobacteria bacterium P01_A01_bin.114]